MNKLENALSIIKKNRVTNLVSSIVWKSDGDYLLIRLNKDTGKEQYQAFERILRIIPDIDVKVTNDFESNPFNVKEKYRSPKFDNSTTTSVKVLWEHPNADKLCINKESKISSPSGEGLSICMIEVKYAKSTAKHYFETLEQGESLAMEFLNDISAKHVEITLWE